jgi:polyphosphate kinase 2 (PPK2 family)
VIDGTDPQRRSFAAGNLLLSELNEGFKAAARHPAKHRWPQPKGGDKSKFSTQSQASEVDDEEYKVELERLQGRFALLTRRNQFRKHGAVFAFEGMDAAGKGGAIRRLTGAMDARQYNVVPISAPTPDELAHPYLWRFWRHVPDRGEIAIFDRSWYGRVLVERVRDLTPEADWQRAYDEIREFERELAEHRIIVHKFWLAVSKDEQLKRFRERDEDKLKRFKVDPEDWANRRFYDAYGTAAHQMIQRTDTDYAPWTVVEADDKKYARLKVLRTVCEAIEKALS